MAGLRPRVGARVRHRRQGCVMTARLLLLAFVALLVLVTVTLVSDLVTNAVAGLQGGMF